jgi:hypothetical protein
MATVVAWNKGRTWKFQFSINAKADHLEIELNKRLRFVSVLRLMLHRQQDRQFTYNVQAVAAAEKQ